MARRRQTKPFRDPFDPGRGCQGKRRYPSEGDALVAAMIAGCEPQRRAYLCAGCGQWHLASK